MADPFLGELRLFSYAGVPRGWATCAGQLLPINQNQALFSLLGTTYGGNGVTTFALPDLRGRSAVHTFPGSHPQGAIGGEVAHTLTQSEMPAHTHQVLARAPLAPGDLKESPSGATWAQSSHTAYTSTPNVGMSPSTLIPAGGNQPHENMPPYLVLAYCIATQGIFPSRD